jgi:Flp pilus assembly protein TadG
MRIRSEQGAAVLEMALVLSILLVVLFGIIQFGLTFHRYQGMEAASNEGARLASLPESSLDEVTDRVRDTLSGMDPANEVSCPPANPGEYCILVTPSDQNQPCNLRRGQLVTVEVAQRTKLDVPMWASPELTLTGRGVYRCEG